MTHTPGPWHFACDSYGKVRHSRKACVYTTIRRADGDSLVDIAKAIPNWDDAKLIAAAPNLVAALKLAESTLRRLQTLDGARGTLDVIRIALAEAGA